MPVGVRASFRFYAELNDFLSPPRRYRTFTSACAKGATTKHMIEALGVPHTEVELILVNGASVGFEHKLADGDRVAVYPRFEALDVTPVLRVRAQPLRVTRFIADAHLGGLARMLRMAGFDTLYDNRYQDAEIVALAARDGRIILSRDLELLKRREVSHGCYVHAIEPGAQLREVIGRLDLGRSLRPLSLCLKCNVPLHAVTKETVLERLPERVRAEQTRFSACDVCGRVYWEGSHWRAMRHRLERLLLG